MSQRRHRVRTARRVYGCLGDAVGPLNAVYVPADDKLTGLPYRLIDARFGPRVPHTHRRNNAYQNQPVCTARTPIRPRPRSISHHQHQSQAHRHADLITAALDRARADPFPRGDQMFLAQLVQIRVTRQQFRSTIRHVVRAGRLFY